MQIPWNILVQNIHSIPYLMVVKWPAEGSALLLLFMESIYSIPGKVLLKNFLPFYFPITLIVAPLRSQLRNVKRKEKAFQESFILFWQGLYKYKWVSKLDIKLLSHFVALLPVRVCIVLLMMMLYHSIAIFQLIDWYCSDTDEPP